MLKWPVYNQDDYIRLPRFFFWLTLALYVTALIFVILGWANWYSIVRKYDQTFLLMVM